MHFPQLVEHSQSDKGTSRINKVAPYMILMFRDILPGVELKAHIEKVRADDTFAAERKTCSLLGNSPV